MVIKTPVTVRWVRADVPDGGCVELVDADGFGFAYWEAKQNRWRSSDEGKRFLLIAALLNNAHKVKNDDG